MMYEVGNTYYFVIDRRDKISFYTATISEINDDNIKVRDKFDAVRILNRKYIIEAELKTNES